MPVISVVSRALPHWAPNFPTGSEMIAGVLENSVAEKEPAKSKPVRAKTSKAKAKAASKATDPSRRADALLGKRFTHRARAEWGIGTVVDGAENALVLSWSDGIERRTARTYMHQLVEVP